MWDELVRQSHDAPGNERRWHVAHQGINGQRSSMSLLGARMSSIASGTVGTRC